MKKNGIGQLFLPQIVFDESADCYSPFLLSDYYLLFDGNAKRCFMRVQTRWLMFFPI